MQLFTRLGFVVVLVSLAVVSSASRVAAQRHATTTVTRLYTGADGLSHALDTEVAWQPAKLHAELNESESVKVTGAQFLRWPRGFVWEGHPASKRQYVIIISGRGEVDVVGGKKVELAPGRVLLAEDVTGKGHTTRVGADEDLVMLLVPLAQTPAQASSPIAEDCPREAPLEPGRQARDEAISAVRESLRTGPEEWRTYEIRSAYPATENPEGFGAIALRMCGPDVGRRTWVVEMHFPKLEPSASLSQGQAFVSRFQSGWRVWHRYH